MHPDPADRFFVATALEQQLVPRDEGRAAAQASSADLGADLMQVGLPHLHAIGCLPRNLGSRKWKDT